MRVNILIIPTNDWMRAPGHGHIDFIAEKLAAKGHRVYVWHFDIYRHEQVRRKPRKVRLIETRTLWIRDPAFFYAINSLFLGLAFFKAIQKLRIDVIINENILAGLTSFLISGRKVLKVFDFSDYFPESASIYYAGALRRRVVESFVLAVTNLNIRFADMCLAVCRSLIENVRSVDGKKACYLLTNGAETKEVHYESIEGSIDASPSDATIIVMGVIDDWLDLRTPIESLLILRSEFPAIKLVIIGPWRKEEHKRQIEDLIEAQGLQSHVEITGYVTNRRLVRYLSRASCCVMPYRTDTYGSSIRLPEKLFVYSAYSKPILSTRLPEVVALGAEHVFFYDSISGFAQTVSAILSDSNMRTKLSRKAGEFAQEYDLDVLATRLEQILSEGLGALKWRCPVGISLETF